ncbi:MAG: hypothetical protein V1859_00965 [archaeon]
MISITKKGMKIIKILFSDYLIEYNANTLKGKIGISHTGTVKILNNLTKYGILIKSEKQYASTYILNYENKYVNNLLRLIYSDHSDYEPYIKGIIGSIFAFNEYCLISFVYGSILSKGKKANDIDICLILKDTKNLEKIREIEKELNKTTVQKLHLLLLPMADFAEKLNKKDPVIYQIIKNTAVVSGEDKFIEVLINAQKNTR